ncbi:MAG: hypothetical protein ABIF87_05965 [Pseudomonadota bacterium]
MRYKTLGLSIVLIMTTMAVGAWAAETRPMQAAPQYPVDENTLNALTDEPAHHFHQARESFLKKDAKAAADEIRKGAAFLKLEAARATEEAKKGLNESIQELEKLAKSIEKGTVASVKELDNAFARAHYTLARHHYLKAVADWTKKETVRAGHALKAAAIHLEQGLAWAGRKLEAGAVAVFETARGLVGIMLTGKQ